MSPTTTEPEQAIAEILPGAALNPGFYETDMLGMPIQHEIFEPMRANWIRPGEFQLVDQQSGRGPNQR